MGEKHPDHEHMRCDIQPARRKMQLVHVLGDSISKYLFQVCRSLAVSAAARRIGWMGGWVDGFDSSSG